MSFLLTASRPSSRNSSRNSMTSPSLGGTSSPYINSATASPSPATQHTIKKHSSADENVPIFPLLPSSLASLSGSFVPREASESRASDASSGTSLFREVSEPILWRSSASLFRDHSSASQLSYEELTPSSSSTSATSFFSPKEEDELLLAVVAEAVEGEEAAALAGTAPSTPVKKQPVQSIQTFTQTLLNPSGVASPVKVRPGLFGTRSCSSTPVPSPIKSDTPSPQRPALTVEVDEIADVDYSLNQLKL